MQHPNEITAQQHGVAIHAAKLAIEIVTQQRVPVSQAPVIANVFVDIYEEVLRRIAKRPETAPDIRQASNPLINNVHAQRSATA